MVSEIKSLSEFESAVGSDKLVVVDFYATWCGPCKMIAPMIEKFATQFQEASFYKVDVDAAAEVAHKYQITSMPTILFFKNGQAVDKVVGADVQSIRTKIAQHL
ncbi:ACL131Wp [Eremothecium gossypii ATCC 10895]|uniref:Thioredoxin n=1 Tax=Eremothecium gossypii (strain ATCC 10895 / CBS 109.51 / FGSC 9923 / NRRL Y-1056) TaxID=284811 RepID=Q75CQ0_EREGS|nr:ACL131Wp [Eremothecium gossypii ATCC 10895]AAS51097.1 ACL131Wp [Eremothecium gossypii ATCC 10895]AEY95387.1 FACL131Wp [Eremothecium gossypii FDAG1]